MKIKLVVLVFFLVFSTSVIFSQSVYQEGYIVTNNSDTIYGSIQNNSFYNNSKCCNFKKNPNDTVTKYLPTQIKEYRFNTGKYYASANLDGEELFLEYLVKGKLKLLFNRDIDNINHFYIEKENYPIAELYSENRYIVTDSIGNLVYDKTSGISDFEFENKPKFNNKKFIGILNYFTSDYPQLQNDIANITEVNHQTMIAIVNKYNSKMDKGDANNSFKKEFKRKVIVQISGGSTMINISEDNGASISNSINPTYGTNILFQQTERNENFYLGIGFFDHGYLSKTKKFIRVPFSINYINSKQGFSPSFSYQFDLNYLALFQVAEVGLKYQLNKFSLNLTTGVHTNLFIRYYAANAQLKLAYTL